MVLRLGRVGKTVVEFDKVVNYGTSATEVLTVDPMKYAPDEITDWEGYIYFKELSGNAITVSINKSVTGIEVSATSLSIPANGSDSFMMVESVTYNVYISSTASGLAKVGVRLTFYTSG